MSDRLTRRRFALLTAGVASVPLAGCSEDAPGEGADGDDGGYGQDGADDGNGEDGGQAGTEVEADAAVRFEQPEDGATAANGVVLEMAAENFEIEEAGEVNENAGHFHVIVDEGPVDEGKEIPSDDEETYVHFGDGSSRGVLDLEPGDHELTLQAGDGEHTALPLTDTAAVTVEEASVSFEAPADGATVESPVQFEFGTSEGLEVEESGSLSQAAGHFHLVVDEAPVETGEEIPGDDEETFVHFGDGATEAEVELPTGEHDLVLQMGDGEHLALPETDEITIEVE